jgi:hypothetical protein
MGSQPRDARKPRVLFVVSLSAAALIGVDRDAAAQPAVSPRARPYLDIVAASVEEVPPIEWGRIAGRQVRLRIQAAGTPTCTSATASLEYGFLVDSDKSAVTGATNDAFADLGVDARVAARCDPRQGTFVSPIGTVTVSAPNAAGVTTIDLLTTAGRLPSVDFLWVAYAAEGGVLTRLPQAPGHNAWNTIERALH